MTEVWTKWEGRVINGVFPLRRFLGGSDHSGVFLTGYLAQGLPNAALKLKQGFGRLIRRTTDVGAVVLLDRRIVTKRYGQLILEGLPPASRVVGSWQDVRRACEEFFAGHGIEAALSAEG